MYRFDSESFIREMEELNGVEDTPINYEDYEEEQYERITERTLKGDL